MKKKTITQRKKEHLLKAEESFLGPELQDRRFNYEPLLEAHPLGLKNLQVEFCGKKLKAPLWISSMTGGAKSFETINKRLATVACEFGLGMGLGSCRPLLENPRAFKSFNLRPYIGHHLPLFANLGLAQVEKILEKNEMIKVHEILDQLRVDGLIIHINPLQEWLQEEGDRFTKKPIETLQNFISQCRTNIIVKEVGQGMGPESLLALSKLPLCAIEFASFGGTNFSKLEIDRQQKRTKSDFYGPLAYVGHSAQEMIEILLQHKAIEKGSVKNFIVSGGIKNFLDAHALMEPLRRDSDCVLYGQAGEILKWAAKSEKELKNYIESQLEGLSLARGYLKIRKEKKD